MSLPASAGFVCLRPATEVIQPAALLRRDCRSDGRCDERLTEAQRNHLLQVLLKEDDPEYTRMVLHFCQIQPTILGQYADIAQKFGWSKVGPILQSQGPSAPPPYQGSPSDASRKQQRGQAGQNELQDKNVLSSMTPAELERFGAVGNICEGLTSDHFKSKDLRASSLSLINANCFRHIKPEAFSGLSGRWQRLGPGTLPRRSK